MGWLCRAAGRLLRARFAPAADSHCTAHFHSPWGLEFFNSVFYLVDSVPSPSALGLLRRVATVACGQGRLLGGVQALCRSPPFQPRNVTLVTLWFPLASPAGQGPGLGCPCPRLPAVLAPGTKKEASGRVPGLKILVTCCLCCFFRGR